MFLIVATRQELASFFADFDLSRLRQTPLEAHQVFSTLARRDSAIIFDDQPKTGDLPVRVVVRDDDVQDFFAWTSTYIESLSPLTGVVEVSTVSEAMAKRIPPMISLRARNGLVAAVLVDGLLQSRARNRIPDAILPAALRTLSAVVYQTTVAGSTAPEITHAVSMWATARESLIATEMPFEISYVLAFWSRAVSGLVGPPHDDADELVRAVHRYFRSDDTSPWQGSPWATSFGVDLPAIMRASREERLRFVDRQIKALEPGIDIEVKSAFGGYLLSLVADGDFNLWPTSLTFTAYPTLPLWFGLFVGGSSRSNVLAVNQSVARRLINLLRYRSDDIDIDVRELLISRRLRTKPNTVVDFPLATFSVLKARLVPDVCGWFSVREPHAPPSARDAERLPGGGLRAVTEARTYAERIVQLLSPLLHTAPKGQRLSPSAEPERGETSRSEAIAQSTSRSEPILRDASTTYPAREDFLLPFEIESANQRRKQQAAKSKKKKL